MFQQTVRRSAGKRRWPTAIAVAAIVGTLTSGAVASPALADENADDKEAEAPADSRFSPGPKIDSGPVFDSRGRRPDGAKVRALRAKLPDDESTTRVIVQLHMRFKTAADLPADEEASQRRELNALQDRALGRVAGGSLRHAHKFSLTPAMVLDVTRSGLDALAAAPEVAEIVEDKHGTVADTNSGRVVQSDFSQAIGMEGQGEAVAIVDTGVHSLHPYLGKRIVAEACFSYTITVSGTARGQCPNHLAEQTGAGAGAPCTSHPACPHGTHVAGIAAGNGAGQTHDGSPVGNGVAPRASILAVQVFQMHPCDDNDEDEIANNTCLTYAHSDLIKALEWVYSQRTNYRIAAVNMSLGGDKFTSTCDTDSLKPVVDKLAGAQIATVVSAGNEGWRDSIGHPACISSTVSVGSTTNGDEVSSFSNAASFMDLWAPGDGILSSVPGGTYDWKWGTSMAAPQVTGAFAAFRQYRGYQVPVSSLALWFGATGVNVRDSRPAITNQPKPEDNRPAGSITKPRLDLYAAIRAADDSPYSKLAQARVISGPTGSVTTDNVIAAKEVLGTRPSQIVEPNHAANAGGASVWFRWTAPSTGRAVFTTSGSNFDTLLHAYRAGTGFGTSVTPGNDDCKPSKTSRINVPVTAGTVYNIAVDGFRYQSAGRPSTGAVKLGWQYVPANDDIALAQTLGSWVGYGTATGTNVNATMECNEPLGATNGVWWKYTAPADGIFTVSTAGSSFNTVMDLFRSDGPGKLVSVADSDDEGPGLTSVASVFVTSGKSYYVRVRGLNGASGSIKLSYGLGTPAVTVRDNMLGEHFSSVTLPIQLTGPTTTPVRLQLETANGTATAGKDYAAKVFDVTIEPGATETWVVIPLLDDAIDEPTETFTVKISSITGASIADGVGQVTIVDND